MITKVWMETIPQESGKPLLYVVCTTTKHGDYTLNNRRSFRTLIEAEECLEDIKDLMYKSKMPQEGWIV